MTDYTHVAPAFRDVMKMTDLQRIEFLDEPRWVDYRAASKLMDILGGLMRKPERPRMPNLMVVGASNSGKTTVITRFKDIAGESYVSDEGISIRPILCAEVHKPDERELYNAILTQFWAPHVGAD